MFAYDSVGFPPSPSARTAARGMGCNNVAALGPGGIVMCRFARLVLRSGGFAPTRTAFFFFVTLEGVTRPPSP